MSVLEFRVWDEIYKKFVYSNDFNELENEPRLSQFFDWAKKYASKYPIQQYVGLEDEKIKKIFEGDIVEFTTRSSSKAHRSIKEVVRIENGLLMPMYDAGYTDDEQGDWFTSGFKVIGNIFENPKLINK